MSIPKPVNSAVSDAARTLAGQPPATPPWVPPTRKEMERMSTADLHEVARKLEHMRQDAGMAAVDSNAVPGRVVPRLEHNVPGLPTNAQTEALHKYLATQGQGLPDHDPSKGGTLWVNPAKPYEGYVPVPKSRVPAAGQRPAPVDRSSGFAQIRG